jgi:uncharacterized protein YaaQ
MIRTINNELVNELEELITIVENCDTFEELVCAAGLIAGDADAYTPFERYNIADKIEQRQNILYESDSD